MGIEKRRVKVAYLGRFFCTVKGRVVGERSLGTEYVRIREKLGIGKVGNMMETQGEFSPTTIFSFLLPAGSLSNKPDRSPN